MDVLGAFQAVDAILQLFLQLLGGEVGATDAAGEALQAVVGGTGLGGGDDLFLAYADVLEVSGL